MNPQIAAEKLRRVIGAPPSKVSVWPWHEDGGKVRMVVRIDPAYRISTATIPKKFEDFDVVVERREVPVAHHT